MLLNTAGADYNEAVLIHAWLRAGYWDQTRMRRAELEDWWAEFKRRLRNGAGKYQPGSHCTYCNRTGDCPGYRQHIGSELVVVVDEAPLVLTAENAGELAPTILSLLSRIKAVEAYGKDVRAQVKGFIEQGGVVPGLEVQRSVRKKIDAAKGWSIILEAMDGDQNALAKCVSLSNTEVKRQIMACLPRGKKKDGYGAVLDFADALMEQEQTDDKAK